jgi:formylglycine-generating enzyme required for sulfatase activity
LRDLTIPGALDGASDEARAFVDASRMATRRARARRLAVAIGAPLLVALVGTSIWAVSRARHRAAIDHAVLAAHDLDAKAESTARAADDARTEAFALFEKNALGPAEAQWKRALAIEEDADRQRRDVGVALDLALALDPKDPGARALYADVTLARLLAAERLHNAALVRELRGQLAVFDDGSRAARLHAPGHVRVETDPPGASLTLARYREDPSGRLVEGDAAPLVAGVARELEPGSYLIVAEAPARYPTRYPLLVRRGEESSLRVVLPRAVDVPEGMIYVPAGRTLYGSDDDEATRAFFAHQPVHDIEVGAFLIGRTEVTSGEYAEFLRALPESERKARLPGALGIGRNGRIGRVDDDDKLVPGPYCNGVEPCVDWTRVPVDCAGKEDGEHYAAWLAGSGRLPGARLCTDREWERAARGADDRRYPSGNGDLGPHDACSLATYGGDVRRTRPCAAGTHHDSRSPFGVEDMSGSEWEWVADSADAALPGQAMDRSGGWRDSVAYLVISNRGTGQDPNDRDRTNGIRVCADAR